MYSFQIGQVGRVLQSGRDRIVQVREWLSESMSLGLLGQYWSGADVTLYSPGENTFGALVVRRRVDLVWMITFQHMGYPSHTDAKTQVQARLVEGHRLEPVPAGEPRRANLAKGAGEKSSELFKLLTTTPSRRSASWVLAHLYLCLPKPDAHFTQQLQGENLHTRMWELLLLASFKEQGCYVSQDYSSPDFHIKRRNGLSAWVEAVTANPPYGERYEHVNTAFAPIPSHPQDRCMGAASARFAKTLRSKIERGYHAREHVRNEPFAIAITDFHAPGSMRWTREALITYLYGVYVTEQLVDGVATAVGVKVEHLLGEQKIPAGISSDRRN